MGLAAALFAGGAGLNAFSQIRAGLAEQSNANFNARVADMQALDAERRGEIEGRRVSLMANRLIGEQRAAFGASGVDVATGSPTLIYEDTARQAMADRTTILSNAAREAWGYRVQAKDLRRHGRYAAGAGKLGAAGSLITSGAQYLRLRK
jgi:hypothetical protein